MSVAITRVDLDIYRGWRLVTGFHKSVEGDEKVDESIFLDFGGEFAVVHQCRADGFTRIYAKKRNFFLDFFSIEVSMRLHRLTSMTYTDLDV